jgi:hypothetical protein
MYKIEYEKVVISYILLCLIYVWPYVTSFTSKNEEQDFKQLYFSD